MKISRATSTGVIASAMLCAATGVALAPSSAHAGTVQLAPKLELIKDNDLAAIGGQYAPAFRYIACGVGTGGPYASTWGQCHAGQTPTYASWTALRSAEAAGNLKAYPVILFDFEAWSFTPADEQKAAAEYISKAVGTVHYNHQKIIVTVNFGSQATDNTLSADAAADGADDVSLQVQGADNSPEAHLIMNTPATFLADVKAAIAAVRAKSKTVPVWLGLATDAGGVPANPANLVTDYTETYSLTSGFWLNSNQWAPPHGQGCAPVGCPAVAQAFLSGIGVTITSPTPTPTPTPTPSSTPTSTPTSTPSSTPTSTPASTPTGTPTSTAPSTLPAPTPAGG